MSNVSEEASDESNTLVPSDNVADPSGTGDNVDVSYSFYLSR